MPNPYYTAAAQAGQDPNDPGYAQGPPSFPPGSMQPYPDPTGGLSTLQPGGGTAGPVDEIGQLRDSLMQQFPDLAQPDEPAEELGPTQKLALFGMFLANPDGALDLVRQRRRQSAERARLRAEVGIRMTGVAGEILKAQGNSERAILETRLKMNDSWRKQKEQEYREHLARQQLSLMQSIAGEDARGEADAQLSPDMFSAGAVIDPGTTNPLTGETGLGQSLTPEAATNVDRYMSGAGNPPRSTSGRRQFRRTFTMGPKGPSATLSEVGPPTARDPGVDFDSWVSARFRRGVPRSITTEQLVDMYRKERAALSGVRPGSFGAGAVPLGGGYPDLFRPQGEPGYDDQTAEEVP